MKNRLKVTLLAAFFLAWQSSTRAQPVQIGYSNCLAVSNYSQALMSGIGQLKWFFAHASVGDNIMSGIQSLHATNPTFFPLDHNPVTDTPPAATQSGIIYDYQRDNPGWQPKVDWFTNYVNNGWHYPKADIVVNKFCWIDPDADFNYYINSMSRLETNNLTTWFVYATIPLTPYEDSVNYQRNLFNDSLRTWCRTNNRILYDIADMEAHDTNGIVQSFTYNSRVCQKQFSGYTSDGGHLTTTQAQQMAAKGFYALGAALLTADRDNDGMPDWWEMAHGLNPFSSSTDANTDSDQDGMNNLKEYLSGTDPNNPASVLKLQIDGVGSGACQMEFTANSNVLYTVQYCSMLSSNSWQTLASISSQPHDRSVFLIDSATASSSSRFYRVMAHRAP